MTSNTNTPTFITVGDFRISAKELEKLAPIEATLLKIIGRSVRAKIKKNPTMESWAGDLVLYLYNKITKQSDFYAISDESYLQQMVKSLLKNSIRDATEKNRTADYAPLSFKSDYYDDEQVKRDDEDDDLEESHIWADTTESNDVVRMAGQKIDWTTLQHFIGYLPKRQKQCASLMYEGYSAEAIGEALDIRKSRVYELMNQSIASLHRFMLNQS